MGNYHPIQMKIDTQTKKNIVSSEVTKLGMTDRVQDGRRYPIGNSSAYYKIGNNHRTFMKIDTQTQQNMLSSKLFNVEAYGKKQQKLNVKNDILLKRQRCMNAMLQKSKNYLFAGRSLHTHTACG
jgi:hypothetical protein